MPRLTFLFLTLLATLSAANLKSKIEEAIAASPSLAKAFVGIEVVSLTDGQVLYERNQDHLFVPASNMKLFTTALALMRLGPHHRFTTLIGAERPIDAAGTLAGDLRLVGGGDPSISGRNYPYQASAATDYSLRPIEHLVDQLVARGLKRINGDIVGDDRRYPWEAYPAGWPVGDLIWEYGAPVSALIVNDNSFALTIRPGEQAGDGAQLSLTPPFEFFSIDNRVRTGEAGERSIAIERGTGARELRVWGVVPSNDPGLTQLLAIGDPALFAAEVLRDALLRRGVPVRGRAVAKHRFYDDASGAGQKPAVILAQRESPPLAQLLQVVDKVSQNLHAEAMLREVGAVRRNIGSREAGLAEMRDFLTEAGISKDDYRFLDGSGLSRSTLVTPAAITKLLAYMYKSSYRDLWMSLLPIAGVDGTLASRFDRNPEARGIQAKTGSLGGVRAMSGYAESPEYGPLAFSFIVNNFDAPSAGIARFLDKLGFSLLR